MSVTVNQLDDRRIQEYEKLYTRNSKGEPMEWEVTVFDEGIQSVIRVRFGQYSKKIQERFTEVRRGKNIGKSNETTHFQQACNNAQSKWNKQLRRGYKSFDDLGGIVSDKLNLGAFLKKNLPWDNTDQDDNLKPMLAQKFYKMLKDGLKCAVKKWPVLVQPKINGVRCVAHVEGGCCILLSRGGISYNIPHIQDEIETLCDLNDIKDIILDGELYIKGEILSEITSAVKKPNLKTITLRYYMYDIASKEPQLERIKKLHSIWKKKDKSITALRFVGTYTAHNEKHALTFRDDYISQGYEGAMFRDMKAPYAFGKRPASLIKLKKVISGEFTIVNIIDSEANRGVAIFVCKNDINHEEFKVNPKATIERKRYIFQNPHEFINKMLTVEYYERTNVPKEVPFHAVGVSVRDYE